MPDMTIFAEYRRVPTATATLAASGESGQTDLVFGRCIQVW